jgi:hypothetical protein
MFIGGCCQLILWLLAIYLVFFGFHFSDLLKKSFKDDKCKHRQLRIKNF